MDLICDSHFESRLTYERALKLVSLINAPVGCSLSLSDVHIKNKELWDELWQRGLYVNPVGHENEKINVLSLFDGISCGQIALERQGLEIDNYFASEIDKYATQITMANYPNTKQLGDVRNVTAEKLPNIDLLIGGSPCQGFSFAGKQLNFEDPRSKLFLSLYDY